MNSRDQTPEDLVDQILRDHETNYKPPKRSKKWSHMTLPMRKKFKNLCEISYQLTRGEHDPSDPEVEITINELMKRIEKRLEMILVPASCREKMLDGDVLTEENWRI
ncbi:hypothetical protein CLU79DRAFT_165062 [Phycomyces nitens]|nr:hypothetical protein CLU79DRAFT_165062 [Phycomyces nitens]